jgi:ATP-dependent exoDNAse (exonuclease V) beta subunit
METPPADRAGFGTLAHRILETLDYGSSPRPLEAQIRLALDREGIPATGRQDLLIRLAAVAQTLAVMLTGVAPDEIIREMPFAARFEQDGANVIVDGKVDLLFRKAGVWHIVDYKFSDHPAKELALRYGPQLAVYLEALSAPLPDTTDREPRFVSTGPAPFRVCLLGGDSQGRCHVTELPPPKVGDTAARLIQAARALSSSLN